MAGSGRGRPPSGGSHPLLTAWHVVDDVLGEVDSTDASKLRVVLGYYWGSSARSSFEYQVPRVASAERLARGGNNLDVGLLTLRDAVGSQAFAPVLHNLRSLHDGDPIPLLGHTLGRPMLHVDGTLSEADPDNDLSRGKLLVSASTGNSGSPVFCKGKVIGVFTSGGWPRDLAPTSTGTWNQFTWDDTNLGIEGIVDYVGDLID